MENLSSVLTPNIKYSILGDYTLQILLLPGDKIFTQQNYITHHSDNLKQELAGKIYSQKISTAIKNDTKQIGYVGISVGFGKILVVDALIYQNLCIREKNILAISDSLQVNGSNRAALVGLEIFMKIQLNKNDLGKQQLIFIHSDGTLIDKDLGPQEKISVRKELVIAYQDGIKQKQQRQYGGQFIVFEGPGRLIFEIKPSGRIVHQALIKNSLVFLAYVSFFLFLVLLQEL
ncbi:hypothetical protein pb186bvf_018638 [Paramecium bursaria]